MLCTVLSLENWRGGGEISALAPGAGKSTLAWHICQKWESGELFQVFKVVVYINPAPRSRSSNRVGALE